MLSSVFSTALKHCFRRPTVTMKRNVPTPSFEPRLLFKLNRQTRY